MTKVTIVAVLSSLPVIAANWTFPAGPPVPMTDGGWAFPMDAEHYAKFARQAEVVPIVNKPPGLGPAALYGYNFVVEGRNRGWILDGDDARGWVIYLDWKGNGDLSEAQAQKLERIDGVYQLQVDVTEGDHRYPCTFEVKRISVEGKERLGVRISDGTLRKGVIELDGRRFPFSLIGSEGAYGGQRSQIAVERFAGGQADRYKVTDRFINLAGKSYEFTVDPLGASLTLTELGETRPDRPSLKVGSPAPAFAAIDIAGAARKLAGYRGRMVLMEFWSTSCGPCREEAPRMVALYKGIPAGKVEFLGVTSDTSDETLHSFPRDFKLSWPQVREPFEGPMHQSYRVAGEPTYFVIGPDGAILDTWAGSGETTDRVNQALATFR